MILDAIADYLEENDLGEVGSTLFIGELPEKFENVVSMVYVPSPEPNKSIPYYHQTIDFWSRDSDFDNGMAKLQNIMDLLHRAENYDLDGYDVYLSYAGGTVDDLDRDAKRNHLFKLTMNFIYRRAVESS